MADNVAITAGTGTSIATDDVTTLNGGAVTSVQMQRVKPSFGVDGTATDVTTTTPLPVGGGFVSTANSTAVALAAAGVFTGTSEDISQYSSISVQVFADVASATDGLSMQQSINGTNWDNIDAYTIPAATGKNFGVHVSAKFFRVVYTNGATLQATFRLQTIFHSIATATSSVRPQDARTNDNDMQEVIGYNMAYNGTTWDRMRGDTTSGQWVQVKAAIPAGANSIGTVVTTPTIAVTTSATLSSAATTNATLVKATAGSIYSITASNVGAAAAFLKIFNLTTAPTVGTSVPLLTIPIPASGIANVNFGAQGFRNSAGISFSITNLIADADATAIAAAQVKVMIAYI